MDRRTLLAVILAEAALLTPQAQAQSVVDYITKQLGIKKKLSSKDADQGLRTALTLGATYAVEKVGKTDGYWGDPVVRIPLPPSLTKVQSVLKAVGASKGLDDVHLMMNRAAETAAPHAKALFHDVIKSMTITDAITIIKGEPTAGTQYLKKTTSPRLKTLFTPPMEGALASTGAVAYLDRMIKRNKLQSYLKEDAKTILARHAVDAALNGMFHYIGTEETAIRRDPAKRTVAILKTVFG